MSTNKKPSYSQRTLLEAMHDGNEKSEAQLKAAAGWPYGGIRRPMRVLCDNGWVVSVSGLAGGPWIITPSGRQTMLKEDA